VKAHALRYAAAWLILLGTPLHAAAAANYVTYHYDNARNGWNDRETVLNQSTVLRLKKIADYTLDGEVDAQPLYLNGVAYVATENDTLYAVSPRRGVLWRRHYGSPVPDRYAGRCQATAPVIGIQSTPVIDAASGTIYLVAATLRRGTPAFTLRAVHAATGMDVRSADISALVRNTLVHRQRASLLLSGGYVYVAFAGACDRNVSSTVGRIFAFGANTLRLGAQFATTDSPACGGFHYGTIWGLGFGPAADSDGNLYVSTGNGCIDYRSAVHGGYSDAVLRLTPDLRLLDTRNALFAPCNAVEDNRHDQEIGSAGVMLAPGMPFAIAGGKTGVTYVLDAHHLGGFHACPDHVVFERETSWGLWGGPAAWSSGGRAYVAVAGTGPDGLRVFELSLHGVLQLSGETHERLFNGGQSIVVSSDRRASRTSVVLWTLTRPATGTICLRAYDPLHLRRPLFSAAAGTWANRYGYAAGSPTVVDGYVFVATNEELTIWKAP
jgi:hypothetical protein